MLLRLSLSNMKPIRDVVLSLIHLFLLVDAKLTGTHVDKEKETTTGRDGSDQWIAEVRIKGVRRLTRWKGSGKSRIWQSPFAGDVREAV